MLLLAAVPRAVSADDDFSVWSTFGVSKKLSSRFSASAETEFRTRDGFTSADCWSLAATGTYKPWRWLSLEAMCEFFEENNSRDGLARTDDCLEEERHANYWSPCHRVNLMSTFLLVGGRFTFALREHWQ